YKGIQSSILWDFIKQRSAKIRMFSYGAPGRSGAYYNRAIEDNTLWKRGDLYIEDTTEFNTSYLRAQSSDYGWVDSSFIRLKTISLSYDLTFEWLEQAGISKLRVFGNAQNLFTISSYAGINLESNTQAITMPALRTVTMGVELIF